MNDYQLCLSKINFDSEYQPLFIDVGCNINDNLDDFTELFFSLIPNSKSIAIEPIFFQDYEKKWANDSRVTLIKAALSDTTENKILYTPSIWSECDSGLSSLYKRKVFNDKYKQSMIPCLTLDKLCCDLNIDYIDYLKIDTEGEEFPILKGSSDLLKNKKIKYIQLEYGGTYDDANYNNLDVINFLKSYNYELIFTTVNYYNSIQFGEMLFQIF
jgi:FkbM family methyltransferase